MANFQKNVGIAKSGLCALILFGVASTAQAANVTFRNDTPSPIIVQGFSIINKMVRAGNRHVLLPGQSGSDLILAPGNKLIVISDAKQPTKTLHQQTVSLTGADITISIQPAPPPEKPTAGAPPTGPPPLLQLVPVPVVKGGESAAGKENSSKRVNER